MKLSELQAVIYLWTRDAKMPVDGDTEAYIADTINAVLRKKPTFSDEARAEMAERLATIFLAGKPKRKASEHAKDEAYETFKAVYVEHRTVAYKAINANGSEEYARADFIKLAELRRKLLLAAGQSPEGWERTCRNYCTSDYVTRFSLADLCSRFDVFVRGPIRKNDNAKGQDRKFIQTTRDGKGTGASESGTGTETRTARGERTFTKRPGA